jgi:hypothetical protein
MLKISLFLLSFLFLSCTHKEYVYEYKGEKIKRVDTDGKSTFYYRGDKIYAKYSGINDGFRAFFAFLPKHKIKIFIGDGFLYSKGKNVKITHDFFNEEVENKENIYIFYYPQEYEVNYNKNTKTKVKVTVID